MAPSNIITFNSVEYPLARGTPIVERSLDAFPQKLVIGDTKMRDNLPAPEWSWLSDQRGGVGVKYHTPNERDTNSWYTDGMETIYPNAFVPQLDSTVDTNAAAEILDLAHVPAVDADYIIALAAKSIFRRTGTGNWSGDLRDAGIGAPDGNGVSVGSYRGVHYAWFGSQDQYSPDQGATWMNVASVNCAYRVEFDGTLVKIDANGVLEYTVDTAFIGGGDGASADVAPTWIPINEGISLLPDVAINGMIVYKDLAGRPAIIIGTAVGAFIFDWASKKMYPYWPSSGFASHSDYTCKAMEVFRQDLFVSNNRSVIRLVDGGRTAVPVGLDSIDDIQAGQRGRVRKLLAIGDRWLLMALDNDGKSDRRGTIWRWNGSGWHWLAEAPNDNDGIISMAWAAFSTDQILTYGFTGQNGTERIKWANITDNPLDRIDDNVNVWRTAACTYYSPFFDAGLKAQTKTALDVQVEVANVRTDGKVKVHYALNDSATYTQLGGDIETSGPHTREFGSGLGEEFRNISLRLTIDDASTATSGEPTWVYAAKLHYLEPPSTLRAIQVTVDLGKTQAGKGPRAMRDALWTAKNLGTLATLTMNQPTEDYQMKLVAMNGVRNAVGRRLPGKYLLTFSEMN